MVDIANMVGVVNKLVGGKVYIMIQFDGDYLLVPVNPKDLEISQQASNSNLDILGIGKAVRKENPGLKSTRISSFFPALKSNFNLMGVSPEQCIEFIKNIWNAQYTGTSDTLKIPRILTTGLDVNLNMYFVIDKFTYKYEHGTKDVEYTLQIKEYIPYGAKRTDYVSSGTASARAPSVVNDDVPGINPDETNATIESKTYVIQSGDTLWSIAKRCTGDGNNWKALYELNKEAIGSNPNMLHSGVNLTLPLGWSAPGASSSSTNKAGTKKLKNTKNNTKQTATPTTTVVTNASKTAGGFGAQPSANIMENAVNTYKTVGTMSNPAFIVAGMVGDALDTLLGPTATRAQADLEFLTDAAIAGTKEDMLKYAREGNWDKAISIKEKNEKALADYNKKLSTIPK